MRKLLILAAAVFVVAAPSVAQAVGIQLHKRQDQYGFKKTFHARAAPWFVYWPYETYFNTPAPTGAPFGPSHMSPPANFGQHMYQGGNFAPHPTNGFGQPQ